MAVPELYERYKQHPQVQTDSRRLKPGDLFFALRGPSFNANDFAKQALENGAAFAIVDDPRLTGEARCIVVKDVLETLQELALHHRRQLSCPVLAITGSNGKTTTKELIAAVLQKHYRTFFTEGNLNNHIGVPLTLLRVPMDAEMAIVEMGANHLGEIKSYCAIAEPTHGLITNCGKAHLEGFGGEEGVRKGKGELYDYLRSTGGTIFRNSDLPYLEEMAAGTGAQITYGNAPDARYRGSAEMDGAFLAVKPGENAGAKAQRISTQLVGEYNFANAMAALAIGLHFRVRMPAIAEALEQYSPDNSRSQWLTRGSNNIILDAYNANPSSMRAAIENFAAMDLPHKRLWLGGMKEMGTGEAREHEAIVSLIGGWQWEEVILVGEEFRFARGYKWFADSMAAAGAVQMEPPGNANILLKGSRGSKMENLLAALPE